tara:strand:- start:291 stop:395 length:105 start_codon:yes stop_codon:yes gene_type:complete
VVIFLIKKGVKEGQRQEILQWIMGKSNAIDGGQV